MKSARLIGLILFAMILAGPAFITLTPFPAHAQQCIGLDENGKLCPVQDVGNPQGANPISATQTGGGAGSGISGDPSKTFGLLLGGIMTLFASLTGYAGVLLNDAVYFTVLTMGNYVNQLNAVGVVWNIMRDLGNIVLIFGFLAIGITTILGVKWYGGGTKMLPMLLVAAIFLNFSLFISEAVIDVGNIFASQFYTQINGGKAPEPIEIFTSNLGKSINQDGISNVIMGSLGLQKLYSLNNGPVDASGVPVLTDTKMMLIGFLGILLFIIAAFVMFSLAFILIARFVILLFLIITAPIGFAGLAVPKLEGIAKQWWHKLFEQTITAPILLLMLYVALTVITDQCFLGNALAGGGGAGVCHGFGATANGYTQLTASQTTADVGSFAGILLSFLVAMGLLLACTVLAKSMSAFGASWATKWGGRLSFGAISLAGRGTLGMTGVALSNKRMKAWARTNYLAKGLVFAGKGLSGRTYDVRNVGGVKAVAGAAGIEVGEGATITAAKAHEEKYGYKPVQEAFKQARAEYETAGREIDFKKAQANLERIEQDYANGAMTQQAYEKEKGENERVITTSLSRMSTKQLEELGSIKKANETLVRNLSPQQFEALMKSEKISDLEREKIRDSRFKKVNSSLEPHLTAIQDAQKVLDDTTIPAGDPRKAAAKASRKAHEKSIQDIVRAIPNRDLENAPAELLENDLVLDGLSEAGRTDLIKNEKVSPVVRQKLRARDPSERVKKVYASPPAGITAGKAAADMIETLKMKPETVAKLPVDVLTTPEVMTALTPPMLGELSKELGPAERKVIADFFKNNLPYPTIATWPQAAGQKKYFQNSLSAIWGDVL